MFHRQCLNTVGKHQLLFATEDKQSFALHPRIQETNQRDLLILQTPKSIVHILQSDREHSPEVQPFSQS